RRCDASRVQRFRNFPESTCASPLCPADDWKHIGSVAIRFGPHGSHSALAGYVALWVTRCEWLSEAAYRWRNGLVPCRSSDGPGCETQRSGGERHPFPSYQLTTSFLFWILWIGGAALLRCPTYPQVGVRRRCGARDRAHYCAVTTRRMAGPAPT